MQSPVDDRLVEFHSVAEAERALDALVGRGVDELGELYDGLATAAADERDFGTAARVQRKAIEHGCEYVDIAREMLGWYLLRDGQRVAGESEFAALLAERGEDPRLLTTIGNARYDVGDSEQSVAAFDRAAAAARARDDLAALSHVLAERRAVREELGLAPDADDRLLDQLPPSWAIQQGSEHDAPAEGLASLWRRAPELALAYAWFPRDQHAAALARWPDLGEDLADPDAYCAAFELRLRAHLAAYGRHASMAPLDVGALVDFARERGLDAGSGEARAQYAAELMERGEAIAWPPARNEPCWCGSGRKYKRCCDGAR